MKNLLISLLKFYKKHRYIFSPVLNTVFGPGGYCRFEETCADYSARAIKEKEALMGMYLSVVRILKCQPFYSKNLKYESI